MVQPVALQNLLRENTKPAAEQLVRSEEATPRGERVVRCLACGHRCRIQPGKAGVCRVRFNQDGQLMVPSGYVCGLQVDPIEKKPFFHAFPGQDALSFGMLSCSFHCGYCQNWLSSQVLRDPKSIVQPHLVDSHKLVAAALAQHVPAVVSTYNEPLITADWAVEIFALAKEKGLCCGLVSNGYATSEVLDYLRPYADLLKVDLKCFNDQHYRQLGGVLEVVLESIRYMVTLGYWVEVVTLVVPGFNDSDQELGQIAEFLASVSVDIPWHVTAFHPDYKMADRQRTPASTLTRARQIGFSAGLRFVYAGNLVGGVSGGEDTSCPNCSAVLIRRTGFLVEQNRLKDGKCPDCGQLIPGVWKSPNTTAAGGGAPRPIDA